MLGRTPGNIVVEQPLKGGVIADYDLTEAFFRYVFEKVFIRPWWARCFKPRAVIAVPSGITEVQKCAVETAARAAGAGDVFLIERPMAAAIGVGLPVCDPRGSMIIDIGSGTCDVAVTSLGGNCAYRLGTGGRWRCDGRMHCESHEAGTSSAGRRANCRGSEENGRLGVSGGFGAEHGCAGS